MKAYVRTKSGSLYLVDDEEMIWARLEETADSGQLRTDGGDLSCFPEIKLDEPMILLGPPLVHWTYGRIIMTTPVVEVTYSAT